MKKDKINILYIIGSLNSGGAERQLTELAKALDKKRFNVYIVIYHDIIHYKEILDEENVTVKVMEKKFKYDPSFPFQLASYCKEKEIDIIHAYSESAGFWSRLAGKIAGIKTITHIQNTNYSSGFFRLEKYMGWMDSLMIANSYAGEDEYLENIPRRKIRVIQNGLNLKLIPDKSELTMEPEKNKVICVGRISKQKNYMCLLKAIERIKDKINNLEVNIWGRIMHADKYEEMTKYISNNELGEFVKYRGESPDIIKEMASSQLMVLTSLWEGFPNVVMEALACGTPVIASNVADLKYLVKHGEYGFLFPKNDDKALAIRLLEFFSSEPEIRKRMGEGGRQHVLKNYTIEIMAEKTAKVYEELEDRR